MILTIKKGKAERIIFQFKTIIPIKKINPIKSNKPTIEIETSNLFGFTWNSETIKSNCERKGITVKGWITDLKSVVAFKISSISSWIKK